MLEVLASVFFFFFFFTVVFLLEVVGTTAARIGPASCGVAAVEGCCAAPLLW